MAPQDQSLTTFNNDTNIFIDKKVRINEDVLFYHSEEGKKSKNLNPINKRVIIKN